jgi:polyisoprenoid-binding protein YceI
LVAVIVVVLVAGPFVYIHFIEADPAPKLRLSTPPTTTVGQLPPRQDISGTWKATDGSVAQYRVNEVLFGQDNTATGKTSHVTGTVTIDHTTVKSASITVDMTTFKSDRSQRDRQFQGRIMDTSQFPTSTFVLAQPIAFGSIPARGRSDTVTATGRLTLHGTTRTITTDVHAEVLGDRIEAVSDVPIRFADYNIPNPSIVGITTEDHGILEIKLVLALS